MKSLPAQLSSLIHTGEARRNTRFLLWFVLFLAGTVTVYSVLFHILMARENQPQSWLSGFYWTLTVMTTLGFGDITFKSDLGRAFTIVVLVSGVLFMLVLLPFAFIQFFLAPWLEAQSKARAPRKLPVSTTNHVVFTNYDPVTAALIDKLTHHGRSYALIVSDLATALELHDLGLNVMLGELDDPETYRLCRLEKASMLVVTGTDQANTSVTFTIREIYPDIRVVANANSIDSVDILQLAGASHVYQLKAMLGRALARRAIGTCARANVVGKFGQLLIAEASVTRSPLVGKTIVDTQLRETTGLTVIGIWDRGGFQPARPESLIKSSSVLLLAGTQEQLDKFDELFCIYVANDSPVLVLGGGRVALAAAMELKSRDLDYRIIEQDATLITTPQHVHGSAADLETLERAGIRSALTCIVTTSDDDMNVYLTIYCRRLSPDIQIISRANLERNVTSLHRAGADFVMSYASMGANEILNVLQGNDVKMLAEGLDVFRMSVPTALIGRELRESNIRERTGCHVVAVERSGSAVASPVPETVLESGDELILVGDAVGESKLLKLYPDVARAERGPAITKTA